MDRGRLTIKFDGLLSFQCADGYLAASGLEGERLFLRSPPLSDTADEVLPFFGFSQQCVFRVVPTRSSIEAAERQGMKAAGGADTINTNGEEITYGQSFSLVHVESLQYVSIAHSKPSENDPDCVSCVLISEESAMTASCEFTFVSRYKFHSDGDKICKEDELLIRLAAKPVFLHVSAPPLLNTCADLGDVEGLRHINRTFRLGANLSYAQASATEATGGGMMPAGWLASQNNSFALGSPRGGEVPTTRNTRIREADHTTLSALTREYLDEVNGCEESGISFIMHRYDYGIDRAIAQVNQLHVQKPLMFCGEPISFYHRERESFLTTSVTNPRQTSTKTISNAWETADLSGQFRQRRIQNEMTGINALSGAEGQIHTNAIQIIDSRSASPSPRAGGQGGPTFEADTISTSSRSNTAALAAARAHRINGLVSDAQGNRMPYPVFAEEIANGIDAQDDSALAETRCSITSLWIIEGEDPTLGGPVKLRSAQYRLRHVSTGLYLAVTGSAVDAFFDDVDDASDGVVASDPAEDDEDGGNNAKDARSVSIGSGRGGAVHETALCMITEPRTEKDMQRTLFTLEEMLATTDCTFLVEQDCLVIKNVLTEMYLSTDRTIDGANMRLTLQWQPSVADTIVALCPPEETQSDALFVHSQCQILSRYRDQMQAAAAVKQRYRQSQVLAAKNGDAAAKAEVELWEKEKKEWADITAQRHKGVDADEELLSHKWDIRMSRRSTASRDTMHQDYIFLAPMLRQCQRTLVALINFCSRSEDVNILKRQGLTINKNQRMLFDVQIFRLIIDVILTHFTTLPNDPMGFSMVDAAADGEEDLRTLLIRRVVATRQKSTAMHSLWSVDGEPRLPALPRTGGGVMDLAEIMLPIHAEVHLVCRLACRALLIMVQKDSSLAEGWCDYVPHMLQLDGYRLHVVDTMKEMFTDNPSIPLEAMHQVSAHFISAAKSVRRASYLDFLGAACTIRFKGIRERQEFVCQKLIVEHPDLLCRFVMHEGNFCVVPDEASEPVPLLKFFSSEYTDKKMVQFVEFQVSLMARLVYDGASHACREVIRELFPRDAMLAIIRTQIWTGRERVGTSSRLDVLRSHLLRMAFQCYVLEYISDPSIQLRLSTVLFGSSSLRVEDPLHLSGRPDCEMTAAIKEATLNLLRANPYFIQDDVGRSILMRAVVSIWFRLICFRQYTLEEIKEVIPTFLSLLDGTQDVVSAFPGKNGNNGNNGKSEGGAKRLELKLESVHLMRIREMICQALVAALQNAVSRGADEVILYLYDAHTQPEKVRGRAKPWSKRSGTSFFHAGVKMVTNISEQTAKLAGKAQEATCFGGAKKKKQRPVRADGYEELSSGDDSSDSDGSDDDDFESMSDNSSSSSEASESSTSRRISAEGGVTGADLHAYLDFLTKNITEMFCPHRLVPLLLDVTRYDSKPLTVQSMRMMVDLCVVKRAMAQMILRVNTLPSTEVIRSFDRIHDVAVELKQRQLKMTEYNEDWCTAICMAEATLLDTFDDDEIAMKESDAQTAAGEEGEGRLKDLYSSFALAAKEKRMFKTSDDASPLGTDEHGEGGSEAQSHASEEEGAAAGEEQTESATKRSRASHFWNKTAGATRMLVYSNTIRNRRRALGLSETSTVPMHLVIRAEMMAHWRIHETLLEIMPHVPPDERAFFRLMKFFYFFTQSTSNAAALRPHINTFLNALENCGKSSALCLNVIVSILGTQQEVDEFLSTELLDAFVRRIDNEVNTKMPDNEFVELLSTKIFSKETVSVVSRRRMMLVLRDHNTLRVLTRPRPNPTVVELEFTSALVNLVCNVCGPHVSVLTLAQRMLPVPHIIQIVMQRGQSNPLLQTGSTTRATLADTTRFKLINPYIRALVALYFASPEDNAEDLKRRQADWMGDSQWWAINRLFGQMLTQVATFIQDDGHSVTNKGLNVIETFRMFFLTSVPNCLAAFYINCFDLDAYRKCSSITTNALEELMGAVSFFCEQIMSHANAINITVEEVVNYRRLLGIVQYRGMQIGTKQSRALYERCAACKDTAMRWLSSQQGMLHQKLIGEHEKRDKMGDVPQSGDAGVGGSDSLFREESVSAQLAGSGSTGTGLLLSGATSTDRSIAEVRAALRGILQGDSIIPTVQRKPSEVALMVNALLIRSTHQESIRQSVGRILVAMRQQLFTPRSFVGILNLFYNALDTVLRRLKARVPEDIALVVKHGPQQLVEHEEAQMSPIWEAAKGADKNADASVPSESVAYGLQVVFNDLGMLNVAVSLCSIDDEVVCYSAIRLGVALLHGGNKSVQKSVLEYFITHEEKFFQNVKDIFKKGVVQINRVNSEHQYYMLRRGVSGAEARLGSQTTNMHLVEALRPKKAVVALPGHASLAFMSLSGWAKARGSYKLKLISNVYRLMQLFCEGHTMGMQNYIRNQHDNLHSTNMVHEAMTLLAEVSVFLAPANLDVISQGFDFMTEACQGPCRANQECLINCDICGCIRRTLEYVSSKSVSIGPHKEDPINNLSEEDVGNLRTSLSRTLLALIEGCRDPEVYQKLFIQLPLANIESEIFSVRPAILYRITTDPSFEHHPQAEALFNWLIYLNSIRAYASDAQGAQIDQILERCSMLTPYLGCIEISREDGLERVYFRIPHICSGLTQGRKDALLWEVDRTSRTTKLADFLHKSDEVIFAVERFHDFKMSVRSWSRFTDTYDPEGTLASRFWQQARIGYNEYIAPFVVSYEIAYYEAISMMLAVLVNCILVMFEGVTFTSSSGRSIKRLEEHFVALLCLVQTVVSAVLFYIDIKVNYPIHLYIEYKEKQRYSAGKAKFNLSMKEVYDGLTMKECVNGFVFWFTAQFRVFLLTFAVLSLVVSPYFAAFNLMLMIYKIPTLRTFITAITMNGKQLLLTSLLGVIMLYLFSIIGFLVFSASYDPDAEEPNGNTNCETLLRCFTYILDNGLRAGGGVADVMQPWSWGDSDLFPRILYDMLFYAIVTVVFLNILFGIIIDTFGQMRDEKREKEADMHGLCFICGLDADTLEKTSVSGFQSHVKTEHNMWMYLYFMHHLRRKDPSEFTGQESYVNARIQQNKLDFFPDETCLSLQALKNKDADSSEEDEEDDVDGDENGGAGGSSGGGGRDKSLPAGVAKELQAAKESLNACLKELGNDAVRMRSLLQQLELTARGAYSDGGGGGGAAGGKFGPQSSATHTKAPSSSVVLSKRGGGGGHHSVHASESSHSKLRPSSGSPREGPHSPKTTTPASSAAPSPREEAHDLQERVDRGVAQMARMQKEVRELRKSGGGGGDSKDSESS